MFNWSKNFSLLAPCFVFVYLCIRICVFVFVFVLARAKSRAEHDVEVAQKFAIFLCSAYHGSTLPSIHQIGALSAAMPSHGHTTGHHIKMFASFPISVFKHFS